MAKKLNRGKGNAGEDPLDPPWAFSAGRTRKGWKRVSKRQERREIKDETKPEDILEVQDNG